MWVNKAVRTIKSQKFTVLYTRSNPYAWVQGLTPTPGYKTNPHPWVQGEPPHLLPWVLLSHTISSSHRILLSHTMLASSSHHKKLHVNGLSSCCRLHSLYYGHPLQRAASMPSAPTGVHCGNKPKWTINCELECIIRVTWGELYTCSRWKPELIILSVLKTVILSWLQNDGNGVL